MSWRAVAGAAWVFAISGVMGDARDARAQAPAPTCFDSIPASELQRTIVFLTSRRADSTSPAARTMEPIVDLYTQSVAQELRARLGAKEGELPVGEPRLTWRSAGAVQVVARRDGGVTASPITDVEATSIADGATPRLIMEAVDSIRARGEPFIWPDDVAGDSLVFELRADEDVSGPDVVSALFAPRVSFPVYTVGVPHITPVTSLRSSPGPRYPEQLRARRVTGTVLARFVVGADGQYVRGSFVDATAESMHLPATMFGGTQAEFARAVREALPRMYFHPATVWHCPIPQLVQQPFTFDIADEAVTVTPRYAPRP